MKEKISRKTFVRLGALLGVGTAGASVLAACGGNSGGKSGSGGSNDGSGGSGYGGDLGNGGASGSSGGKTDRRAEKQASSGGREMVEEALQEPLARRPAAEPRSRRLRIGSLSPGHPRCGQGRPWSSKTREESGGAGPPEGRQLRGLFGALHACGVRCRLQQRATRLPLPWLDLRPGEQRAGSERSRSATVAEDTGRGQGRGRRWGLKQLSSPKLVKKRSQSSPSAGSSARPTPSCGYWR